MEKQRHFITLDEAGRNLLGLIKRAETDRVVLTAYGRPAAMLLTVEEYTKMAARLEIYERLVNPAAASAASPELPADLPE